MKDNIYNMNNKNAVDGLYCASKFSQETNPANLTNSLGIQYKQTGVVRTTIKAGNVHMGRKEQSLS